MATQLKEINYLAAFGDGKDVCLTYYLLSELSFAAFSVAVEKRVFKVEENMWIMPNYSLDTHRLAVCIVIIISSMSAYTEHA